jgi:hypothetical protein
MEHPQAANSFGSNRVFLRLRSIRIVVSERLFVLSLGWGLL